MSELTPVLEQGKCPYKTCSSAFFLQHAGVSGFTFINHVCVKCTKEIWTRVGGGSVPESFPLDTFQLHFDVDKKRHTVKPKVFTTPKELYKIDLAGGI